MATKLISPKSVTKAEAKRILALVEQWTRCEIIARLGRFDNLGFADYAVKKIEKADELRKFIYGTSDLVKLGERWKLLPKEKEKIISRKKTKRR